MPEVEVRTYTPTMVLAIRVTPQTYEDIYIPFTNGKRGRKHTLESLEGAVIMVPVNGDANWGWINQEKFDRQFEPLENWSRTRFTLCRAITGE